jgi:hypothetical protein
MQPVPPTRWSAGRIVAIVLGSVLIFIGIGVGFGGMVLGIVNANRNADGMLTASQVVDTPTAAAQLGPVDLTWAAPVKWNFGSALGRVEATSQPSEPATATFIGIGPDAQVAAYLAGTATEQLLPPGQATTSAGSLGVSLPAPTSQTFWVASATGTGAQTLTWISAPGKWRLVVMNADGRPGVQTTVTVSADARGLTALVRVLLVVGGAFLLVGVAMVLIAALHRTTPEYPYSVRDGVETR